jgi:hypothetical protein
MEICCSDDVDLSWQSFGDGEMRFAGGRAWGSLVVAECGLEGEGVGDAGSSLGVGDGVHVVCWGNEPVATRSRLDRSCALSTGGPWDTGQVC